jgi:hypothetical protein
VGHRIGKGTLQQDFRSRISQRYSQLKVPRDIGERFMEMGDSRLEIGKRRWTVAAADEERTCVPQYTVHVLDQLVRRSDLWRGSKRSEV